MPSTTIRILTVFFIMATLPSVNATADETALAKTPQQIIESYVEDFRSDRFAAEPRLFGIEVPGTGEWHVRVTGQQNDDQWGVELSDGPPPEPTFVYKASEARATCERLTLSVGAR